MTLYGWSGPGKLRELGHDRAEAPKVTEPTTPTTPGSNGEIKLHICTAPNCGRRFKKPMMVARHFNTSHDDLRVDKESWREFVKEIWEAPSR